MRTIHVFTILVPSSCFRMMKKCASCWIRSALGASQLIAYLTVGSSEPQFVPGCAVHRRLPKKTPSHPPALYSRACTLYSVSASSHPESGEEPQHRCLASAWAPIGIAPGPRANRKEPNYFLFADRSARTRLPFAF